jgi:hypothetical protein
VLAPKCIVEVIDGRQWPRPSLALLDRRLLPRQASPLQQEDEPASASSSTDLAAAAGPIPLDRVTAPGTPTALGPSSPELAAGHRPAAGTSRRFGRGGHRVDGGGRGGGAARQRRNTSGAWIHLTGWSPLTYDAVAPASTSGGDGIFLGEAAVGGGNPNRPSPSFRSGPAAMGRRRRPLAGRRGWLLAS